MHRDDLFAMAMEIAKAQAGVRGMSARETADYVRTIALAVDSVHEDLARSASDGRRCPSCPDARRRRRAAFREPIPDRFGARREDEGVLLADGFPGPESDGSPWSGDGSAFDRFDDRLRSMPGRGRGQDRDPFGDGPGREDDPFLGEEALRSFEADQARGEK